MTDVISKRAPDQPDGDGRARGRRAADRGVVNSPEALDTVAQTTTSRMWIALAAIGVVVVLALVWACVGTIPQQIQASGVLSADGDTYTVVAGRAGAVSVSVTPGQTVSAGQAIAMITPFTTDGPEGKPVPLAAPIAGRVQDVVVREGQGVQPADPILVVVPAPDNAANDRVVSYLTAHEASTFQVGAVVQVTLVNPATRAPATVDAKVTLVAQAPSTADAVVKTLGSQKLAKDVLDRGDGAGYRVDLQLQNVDQLPPDEAPVPGQIVQVSNTYARPHPINLLFSDDA